MPTPKTITLFALAALVFLSVPNTTRADIPNSETLQHLQAVYSYETNAFERYRAFSDKARAEGNLGAATLFLAASRAAQIQYTSAIDAIRELGFAPEAGMESPVVESTLDNLQAAIKKSEAFARGNQYSVYIKQAKAEGNQRAARLSSTSATRKPRMFVCSERR